MSFEQGVFPTAMKIAKVIPICKGKSKELFRNYRPISRLSNVSKVLEKVVHKRIFAFMEKNQMLYQNQFVNYTWIKSECSVVTHGVQQGSVLGPLLFILYTNGLPNSIRHSKQYYSLMTTTIYATGNNSADLFGRVNEDLSHLTDWFRANQLSVNASKTKYMPISSNNHIIQSTATLKIDDDNLYQVTHTKFLGLLPDQHLCWDHHIQYCAKKISSGLYALNSTKHILNSCNLRMMCHTMINPDLLYGIILWGGTYQKYTKRLNIMQKRAVRTIMNATYNEHTSPLFKATNILKLTDIKFMGKSLETVYKHLRLVHAYD